MNELRAIRNSMLRVRWPEERHAPEQRRLEESLHVRGGARELDPGTVQATYGSLDQYMTMRQADILHELGLRAWGVDFSGGPLTLWWEVEQTGNVNTAGLIGGPEVEPVVKMRNAAKSGRLLFWFLPSSGPEYPSNRSRQVLERLNAQGATSKSIPQIRGLQVVNGPVSELWQVDTKSRPVFWSAWHGVRFTRHSADVPVAVEGKTLLLDLEAVEELAEAENAAKEEATEDTEEKAAEEVNDAPPTPRRLRLRLMAEPVR